MQPLSSRLLFDKVATKVKDRGTRDKVQLDSTVFEPRDALFQRGVSCEEGEEAASGGGDFQGLKPLGVLGCGLGGFGVVEPLERAQGIDHAPAPG